MSSEERVPWIAEHSPWITTERLRELLSRTVLHCQEQWPRHTNKILVIVPAAPRLRLGAGLAAALSCAELARQGAEFGVLVSLAPGESLTAAAASELIPGVEAARIVCHTEFEPTVALGAVPAATVAQACGGLLETAWPSSLSARLFSREYDGALSLDVILPHDLLGFSGGTENLLLGLASPRTISVAAEIAAAVGWENNLANLVSPLRQCLFHAERSWLRKTEPGSLNAGEQVLERDGTLWEANSAAQSRALVPHATISLVWGDDPHGQRAAIGFFAGDDDETYLQAALLSRRKNVTVLEEPLPRIVALFPGNEFSTLQSVMRLIPHLRMALAQGGELICLAPGVREIAAEPRLADLLLRHGYRGAEELASRRRTDEELNAAPEHWAHLLHGSTEGRFWITLAADHLPADAPRQLNLRSLELDEALARYRPLHRRGGWNMTEDGAKFYFVPHPGTGLWSTKKRLTNRLHEFARHSFY
jgi:hypothetical protein